MRRRLAWLAGLLVVAAPATAKDKISAALADGLEAADRVFNEERYDQAIVAYNQLKAKAQGQDALLLSVRVARVHLARGRTHRAQFLLGDLQRKHPNYVPALLEYAKLNLYNLPDKPGSLDKVERALAKARKVAPRNPEAWIETGYLAMARGRFPDAIGAFEKVIETMDRKAYRAYHGLARAHVRTGKLYKAKDAMRACLEQGPGWAENHWMAGNIELAVQEPGSEERAIGNYLYAVGLEEGVPRYKGWAIMAHFVNHRFGQAKAIEEALAEHAPESSWLKLAAGLRLEMDGDVASAKEQYKAAVDLDWGNPWSHWLLANTLNGRGNREVVEVASLNPFLYGPFVAHSKALTHLKAVERLAPEFPFRREVAKGAKRSASETTGRDDPIFREKLGKLQKYLGAIKSAPPGARH